MRALIILALFALLGARSGSPAPPGSGSAATASGA